MPAEPHLLEHEIGQLNHLERRAIHHFIHRERLKRDIAAAPVSFGDRLADRVAAFGGSWTFILISVVAIIGWLIANRVLGRPFDPYPYILLNLVLSTLAALQAPVIMMSQNRQAAHDRVDAQHDYEVNTKAELEIVALHMKLDELREQKWMDLIKLQEQQLALLTLLAQGKQAP